ncbi:DUF2790 domain-containing protein [Pseudomonas atacamensis]|uniref:DUF2790 domain-containing protein n=1 Tax=Pseudomonas atacamensis TaxID=2565368 RepID=A0AAQ2DAA8_9PSED|nr:DUF2790 domain-containing protein [Pseudomonas atacamensis]THF29582.1 DUF2790 domain-containing protein [Pseudomonas atacamensis]
MKVSMLVLALFGFSSVVMAQDSTTTPPVEQYTYASHLEVAKIISEDPVPDVCAVVPVHMTYQDSQGKQHILQYEVMGSGCSNG